MHLTKRALALALSGLAVASMLGAAFVIIPRGAGAQPAASGNTRLISSAGTTSFQTSGSAQGADAIYAKPEIPAAVGSDAGGTGGQQSSNSSPTVNRSGSDGHQGQGVTADDGIRAVTNPEVVTSFDGLNHRQQRLANGGNQFSLEPPDQGLCAAGGFVMETINDVTQVYDASGNPLLNGGHAVDLNTFFGYPAADNRSIPVGTPGRFGQFVTDPSCYFDSNTQRWYMDVLTLEVFSDTGNFTGVNHIDLAVSSSSDPTTSTWAIFHLPVQDDGTQGTPDHGCSTGPANQPPTNPNACLGDYPHIGADATGFYVTTNEYSFFGPEFHGAQIYAFSKFALASGAKTVAVTQIDTHGLDTHGPVPGGSPGFTLWPAEAPAGLFNTANGGTEYFLSSTAADEVQNPATVSGGTHMSNYILQWTLTNTLSLSKNNPSISLSNQAISVPTYAVPPRSNQKSGHFPLGECLDTPSCSTTLLGFVQPFNEVETNIDSNDSRMQQVTYANGMLWGALDTAVTFSAGNQAGVAYYIIDPQTASIVKTGTVGLHNANMTYPAIGVLPNGHGVMAFTLVGTEDFPSAAYADIDATNGLGSVHVAAAGTAPDDGFTAYLIFNLPGARRPRWGDYGAAVVVGNNIWIASEYIGQPPCTLNQYEVAFNCGATRTSLANWDTRITEVTPS